MSQLLLLNASKTPKRTRILLADVDSQKKLAANNLAKTSKRTEAFYIRTFLNFVDDTTGTIQQEYLTDATCSSYIAAVWNAEPFVGPSTIRGNQSHIFHAAFLNVGIKSMKEQPQNFIETIKTIKGIKHTDRWKRHKEKKANIFTVSQIIAMKNLSEDNAEIHIGKVILIATVDCDKRCADLLNVFSNNVINLEPSLYWQGMHTNPVFEMGVPWAKNNAEGELQCKNYIVCSCNQEHLSADVFAGEHFLKCPYGIFARYFDKLQE